jgi:hypothetical protein
MLWLWRDTGDSKQVAALSNGTFWLVLPTLPMFIVLPYPMRQGVDFWVALAMSCVLTIGLHGIVVWLFPRLGIGI